MTTRSHRLLPPPRRWRINWQGVVGVLLVVAGAYTTGSTYQQGEEMQARADCQTTLNRAFLTALQNRDVAARESSEAQRVLLSVPQGATEREKQAARTRYVQALAELDRARSANPLPEETTC